MVMFDRLFLNVVTPVFNLKRTSIIIMLLIMHN